VGVFVKREIKPLIDHRKPFGIIWIIMWIPVESEEMPSSHLSELTIMNYLKTGKGKIHRRNDDV